MKRAFGFLLASCLLAAMVISSAAGQEVERSQLPIPDAPFKGKIGLRPADSLKDFPG